MAQFDDNVIKSVLKYNSKRQYFGPWTRAALDDTYRILKVSQTCWEHPLHQKNFRIGTINNDVICDSLWSEMSYNPVRFGRVSPFKFKNETNDIYAFCRKYRCRYDDTNAKNDAITQVANKLAEFMSLNGYNRKWDAWVKTQSGNIILSLDSGYPDSAYKKLARLCEAVKIVANQNVNDFTRKKGLERTAILETVLMRHPTGIRSLKHNVFKPAPLAPCPLDADVLDAEYTLETRLEHLELMLGTYNNQDESILHEYHKTQQQLLQLRKSHIR